MKYVMVQDQEVNINGYVAAGTSHDKVYNNEKKKLTEDFLTFEHTDGLNYVLVEGARVDDISSLFGIRNTDNISGKPNRKGLVSERCILRLIPNYSIVSAMMSSM